MSLFELRPRKIGNRSFAFSGPIDKPYLDLEPKFNPQDYKLVVIETLTDTVGESKEEMKKETLKLVADARTQIANQTDVALWSGIRAASLDVYYENHVKNDRSKVVANLMGRCAEYLERELAKKEAEGWILVESDSIAGIKYNSATRQLWVKFTSAGNPIYSFANVPNDVYIAFLSDKSKGRFFQRNIKGRYTDTRY